MRTWKIIVFSFPFDAMSATTLDQATASTSANASLTHPSFFVHERAMCDAIIGEGSRVWANAHVMNGSKVGAHCNIGEQCFVESGAEIGDGCTVKNGVSIWDGVCLEDQVFVGPNAVFTNDMMPRTKAISSEYTMVPTRIKRGASIGANATIVCGTTLGEYCMIGAGAVVTRDVPAFALVIGNPARIHAWVSMKGEKLSFNSDGIAHDTDGRRYRMRDERVELLS